jgi:hypothetical protein
VSEFLLTNPSYNYQYIESVFVTDVP